MFSTTNLFKKIACPEGTLCRLPNCIFSHDFNLLHNEAQDVDANKEQSEFEDRTGVKRRKIEDNVSNAAANAAQQPLQVRKVFTGYSSLSKPSTPMVATTNANQKPDDDINGLQSVKKDISPPPKRGVNRAKGRRSIGKSPAAEKPVSLNPRLIAHDPAGHDKRRLYVSKLHENLVRLNELVSKSKDASHKQFALGDNDLKLLALDEELGVALEYPKVYGNVIKNRLVAYSRMSLDDWLETRRSVLHPTEPEKPKSEDPFPPYKSTLTPEEEFLVLPRLVAHQSPLVHHGYVPSPISEEEIIKAHQKAITADNWEVCELCNSRFQVFPDRRESDGALTTSGPCVHHPVRPQFLPKDPTDKTKGHHGRKHACCGQFEGTPGCKTIESHVFVVKQTARLASILPFEETPAVDETKDDSAVQKPSALAFDCEMCYTVHGLELIRLTATEWQTSNELLDVLVRPLGAILDLNSRFSGVWPEDLENAEPYDGIIPPPPRTSEDKEKPLRIVPSPQAARKLLLSLLTPKTPVMGHALENDLNTVRLIHPTIVDTALLFPHVKGLPRRRPLREIAKKYLDWQIQTAGKTGASKRSNEGGHDSKEDARAAGELVRVAVDKEWKKLKGLGWEIKDGKLLPPPGKETTKKAA